MPTSIPSFLSRLTLLAVLGFPALTAQAQVAAPTWASVTRAISAGPPSGSQGSQASKVAVAADGSHIVSGFFDGTLTLNATTSFTAGTNDAGFFVARYNADGTLAWARHALTSSHDESNVLTTVDAAGNVYLAGYFGQYLTLGTTSLSTAAGQTDSFVAKYDPQGNLLWARRGEASASAYCTGVAADAAGNVYLTGDYSGTLAFGSTTTLNSTNSASDIFLCKISPAGTAVWLRSAGSASLDYGGGLAADAAGNTYLTGSVSLAATFGTQTLPTVGGEEDLFVAKYDTQGNALWARRSGGSDSERGAAVAVDAAGRVAVTGYADYRDVNGSEVSAIYVAAYAPDGTRRWERKVQPAPLDAYSGYDVAYDNRGGLYLTGPFQGSVTFGSTVLTSPGAALYVVRYDQAGNVVWAGAAGGSSAISGAAVSTSLATDAQGNAYVAGGAFGSVRFGSLTSQDPGISFFVAKLNAGGLITGSRPAQAPLALAVYPNPATEQTMLLLPAGGGHLVLTDALGRTVREQALPTAAGPCPVALRGLAPGLYALRATLAGGTVATARLTVR
ncbi:hypothetical protein SAMN02745146_1142 [Hymenobacter daecheongensis DSM 21074]|uniref:Por secretion system C-terminal sorting domain-containing protein n=1 Tax=Hymenobacter daecheongensis DSM 21074 TaxID=1121955 RepID=A0A1M6CG71_9BACT|nr:T9SS type A sorting domain-containing protein [Hymenobacter daecheongensis]SHI59923.1 hypothetical protein SAMN02745146_1142 [Hymenobacter daecheongensis DSM 21074]